MKKTAILGGGQLARMLIESAQPLGLTPLVYVQDKNEPATELAAGFEVGSWDDEAALRRLFQKADVVVFENEFVNLDAIRKAAAGLPVRFAPSLDAFSIIQHKCDQKRWLVKNQFATTPYTEFESMADYFADADVASRPHVLKWGSRGYDGKGILPVDSSTPKETVTAFFDEATKVGSLVFAEEKVNFLRELAVLAVRNASGEKAVYPLVASIQEEGICWWVKGPAAALGISREVEKEAQTIAIRALELLKWEGALAIEFFQTSETRISINELAPRVHNSGHFSQNGADTSQFENHWRGALQMKLGSGKTAPFFAMRNLLGPTGYTGTPDYTPHNLPEGAFFHWYGKKEVRPKRKIGHVNVRAASRAELDSLCERVDKWVRSWESSWQKRT